MNKSFIQPSCGQNDHVWIIDPYQRQTYECIVCGRVKQPFQHRPGAAIHHVTWRYWNTFSHSKFAMQSVRNAYRKGYQFAFRYY